LIESTKDKHEGAQDVKIAIPVAGKTLCPHFGHCEQFALYEVEPDTKRIINTEYHNPPAHEPGVLPRWLSERGATVIIAGGMGQRAQQIFTQNGVKVIVGAQSGDPQTVVEAYLRGTLTAGANLCDH
jgi:predicted Fe-Mo cluster-binding NifX family protein